LCNDELELGSSGQNGNSEQDKGVLVMKRLPLSLFVLLGFAAPAMAGNTVQNGSLENIDGTFMDNTGCNYMTLGNGSTTIPDWTVSTSSGAIVWAQSPTCDGYTAADGAFFVDLSGLGNSSPDGALNQSLSTLGGVTYTFSMDVGSGNDGTISASVGSQVLVLTAGTAFLVNGTSWTPETGTFVGNPLDTTPLLTIVDATPGSSVDFVDNFSITGTPAPTPEPASLGLYAMGLAGFAVLRRTRARRS
jgi:hypothetical protein